MCIQSFCVAKKRIKGAKVRKGKQSLLYKLHTINITVGYYGLYYYYHLLVILAAASFLYTSNHRATEFTKNALQPNPWTSILNGI